jgi:crotonobetaine/carnitine-CoA ligase
MKSCESAPDHTLSRIFCVPPPPELDEFEARFRTKILWHAFGQTEISPLGMRPDILPGVAKDTIGYPVDWMEFGVVDEHDRLLSPGEIGELVFRPLIPYAMFSGYYRNPEATQAALRNFMFHTGDLAFYDSEGLLHYQGRKQERIRRRGENISAPELEYVVLRHPQVVECAAYGVPSEFGEEDVKLDVRCKSSVDPIEFHDWLTENLPKYMVPRYLEMREEFPKTPSERIQKYILKEQALDRPEVHDFDRRR